LSISGFYFLFIFFFKHLIFEIWSKPISMKMRSFFSDTIFSQLSPLSQLSFSLTSFSLCFFSVNYYSNHYFNNNPLS
jgi:hypothetical protein